MKRAAVAIVAVVGAATAAGGAAVAPWVDFMRAGDTYDPASVAILGDGEGTHGMTYPGGVAGSGVSLTAVGTRLANTGQDNWAEFNGISGVGMLPLQSQGACDYRGGAVGRNPSRDRAPRRNGIWHRVPWTWVGCTNTTTWRVADGVTTYTVSRLKRVYRPAVYRTIWEDQGNGDAYFNTCLQWENLKSIRQSGGRRYCRVLVREKIDRTTYRLTQRTTITKVYPAYVTP